MLPLLSLPISSPMYDEVVVAGEYTDEDDQEVLVDSSSS